MVCELSIADQGVGGEKAGGVASSLILAENDVVYETEGKNGVIGNTPLICMHNYNIEVFAHGNICIKPVLFM